MTDGHGTLTHARTPGPPDPSACSLAGPRQGVPRPASHRRSLLGPTTGWTASEAGVSSSGAS